MSERLLKALMQLFAIIARPRTDNRYGRGIVESFLEQQLNQDLIIEYLQLYDGYFALYQKKQSDKQRKAKNLSLSSVKVLKICTQINEELDLRQKVVVLIRLLEFIKSDSDYSTQELEFVLTVAEIFHLSSEEFELLRDFVLSDSDKMSLSPRLLLIDNNKTTDKPNVRHLYHETLDDHLWVMHFQRANLYLARCFGSHELYLNGQLIINNRVYIMSQGSAIRDSKLNPIYYSDIISAYYTHQEEEQLQFTVNHVSYRFKGGNIGLNDIHFAENSGNLVGIMGGSGAGKSTLLNVLNGSNKPSEGSVSINGIDIHTQSEEVEGLIGYVSQDDLLIEELTVYQNLYYNAKLCFGNLSPFQLNRRIFRVLYNLGLFEIRHMIVGSPLNKKISGGQRKRLNIALELIREPAILFLDEPTSGLSSRDSENIMDLLKELALKGKLIFTVIHQPSSDIFKMFDKLYILDQGGYLIYNGNPVDSIIYFKSKIHHASWNDSECHVCGNVNPEQIFNIVEAHMLDEYGGLTQNRRKTPKQWYNFFKESRTDEVSASIRQVLPHISFKVPDRFKQFLVFMERDVVAKMANRQYMIINLLEAPVLAFLLSFIIRYYKHSASGYSFVGNSNLPVYIFMAVIVAIFIGLTVSAEEIIKDRKILKRESFLNLSRTSYLFSKLAILFVLSAFQAAVFIFIGNTVLEINAMYWQYWLVLFSAWFFANLLGLNISDGFDTVVTIYILIPFLVIPQLILSGIIVPFDKLNPAISTPAKVPWYGEIITARWAYEALAVYQFKENKFEQQFYPYDKVMSNADFKKNYWLKTVMNKLAYCERNYTNPEKQLELRNNLALLRYELNKELQVNQKVRYAGLNNLFLAKLNEDVFIEANTYLDQLRNYYLKKYNNANNLKDKLINTMQDTPEKRTAFLDLKNQYSNENLTTFVRNSNSIERIVEVKGKLYQKIDPVYMNPPTNSFIKAHFYAPYKMVFGAKIDTFWVNLMVIWASNLGLYLMLHFSLLRKTLTYFAERRQRRADKKNATSTN